MVIKNPQCLVWTVFRWPFVEIVDTDKDAIGSSRQPRQCRTRANLADFINPLTA